MSLGLNTADRKASCSLVGVSLANRSFDFGIRVPRELIVDLLSLPHSQKLAGNILNRLQDGLNELLPEFSATPVHFYRDTLIPVAFTVSHTGSHLGISADEIEALISGEEEELFYETQSIDRPDHAIALLFAFNTWLEIIELCV